MTFQADGEKVRGAFGKLNDQIFHLAKRRPVDPNEKFDVTKAKDVADWVENNMSAFIAELKSPYSWNADRADPKRATEHVAPGFTASVTEILSENINVSSFPSWVCSESKKVS